MQFSIKSTQVHVLLFALLGALFSCTIKKSPIKPYTYSAYLADKELARNINSLIYNNNYLEAIEQVENIQCVGMSCLEKAILTRKIHLELGETKLAFQQLIVAVDLGLDPGILSDLPTDSRELEIITAHRDDFVHGLDDSIITVINNLIKNDQSSRETWRAAKQNHDSTLLNKALIAVQEIDVQNKKVLYEIVQRHGWPSIDIVGQIGSRGGLTHSPALLVKHYGKQDNQYYLELIIQAAYLGDESWSIAEELQRNLLIRFSDEDGYRSFQCSDNFDEDRQLLRLNAIASILSNSPSLKFNFLGSPLNQTILSQIIDKLADLGVRRNQLSIIEDSATTTSMTDNKFEILFSINRAE